MSRIRGDVDAVGPAEGSIECEFSVSLNSGGNLINSPSSSDWLVSLEQSSDLALDCSLISDAVCVVSVLGVAGRGRFLVDALLC